MTQFKKWWGNAIHKSKPFFRKALSFAKVWREFSSILLGLLLWFNSPILLRMLDPTAGIYDAGVFQIYLFAVIGLYILHGVVRILMKLIWPTTDHYLDNQFAHDFQLIAPWKKLKLSVSIFFALLFALVLLARVL
ncbi:hypothetical protein [Nafulsella turpanensis]|uniref:hypothetical protein n=1 Tax=Nafulsella turpanensis TaxID=1265690 RepID=UPI00034698B4|nr:hypothetical protein [Nafulsella turpanensis]